MAEQFPQLVNMREVRISIDETFNWVVEHWGETLEQIFLPVVHLLTAIENFLLWLPWYVVVIVIVAVGYAAEEKMPHPVGSLDTDKVNFEYYGRQEAKIG